MMVIIKLIISIIIAVMMVIIMMMMLTVIMIKVLMNEHIKTSKDKAEKNNQYTKSPDLNPLGQKQRDFNKYIQNSD